MKKLFVYSLASVLLMSCGKKTADSNINGGTGSMDIVFNGSHHLSNVSILYDQSTGHCGLYAGAALNSEYGVTIAYTGTQGSFNFGAQSAGNVDVNVVTGGTSGLTYYTNYTNCNSNTVLYTSGTLNVKVWGSVGQEVTGSFSGSVVDKSNCTPVIVPVSGTFTAIRRS